MAGPPRRPCGAAGSGRLGRRGGGHGAGELDAALDGLGELLVVDRELEEVDGSGADDVAEAGVGPAAEGQHEAHGRQLLADQPEPGQPGTGAEARPGHEHVEGPFALEDLGDRAHARARHDLRLRRDVGHRHAELLGERLAAIEDEDLGCGQRDLLSVEGSFGLPRRRWCRLAGGGAGGGAHRRARGWRTGRRIRSGRSPSRRRSARRASR